MPRYPDPAKSAHQQRQQRYRTRLTARRAPEADSVDAAMAASLACYIDAIRTGFEGASARMTAKLLLRGTLNLLVAQGYDREEAAAVLRRRLTHRDRRDLGYLIKHSRMRTSVRQT